MTHINSTEIEVCTPKKAEKLPTYSPRLPLKIVAHEAKLGQPLVAPSTFTLS